MKGFEPGPLMPFLNYKRQYVDMAWLIIKIVAFVAL